LHYKAQYLYGDVFMDNRELDKNSAARPPAGPVPPVFANGGGSSSQAPSYPIVGQTRLGSGLVTDIIGKGGMATVYRVWNEGLEVFRAVKLLSREACSARFETEAKITAKLHHEGIVEIHNIGEWNGLLYMEMEFVDGSDLQRVLAAHGRLPEVVCVAIAALAAEALAHAHTKTFTLVGKQYCGVIHRDLKPANIMISRQGAIKLTDFGIARPAEASIHTVDGNIAGTMQYLSPEQMDGGEVDNRSDIYSFGATLYEMVTGAKTFPQEAITELIIQKASNNFKSLDEYDIPINPELKRIIHRCLSLAPAERYQRTQDLLSDLQQLGGSLTQQMPKDILKGYFGGAASAVDTDSGKTKTGWIPSKQTPSGASDALNLTEIVEFVKKPKTAETLIISKRAKKPKTARPFIFFLLLLLLAASALLYVRTGDIPIKPLTGKPPTESTPVSAEADSDLASAVATLSIPDDTTEPASETEPAAAEESSKAPSVAAATAPAAAPRPQPSAAPAKKAATPAAPAKQAAAPTAQAAPAAQTQDDAFYFIEEGKFLLTQNRPQEALASFQRALRTPSSAPRQQVVRQSLYGSAKSNTILFRQGSTSRSNYEAAWRAVQNAFAAGSPEHTEAKSHLEVGE